MEPSNHIVWSAIRLFSGLLVVFHLFVFLWKPDGHFLKKVDYYWLGFTAPPLISAASTQRSSSRKRNANEPAAGGRQPDPIAVFCSVWSACLRHSLAGADDP